MLAAELESNWNAIARCSGGADTGPRSSPQRGHAAGFCFSFLVPVALLLWAIFVGSGAAHQKHRPGLFGAIRLH